MVGPVHACPLFNNVILQIHNIGYHERLAAQCIQSSHVRETDMCSAVLYVPNIFTHCMYVSPHTAVSTCP